MLISHGDGLSPKLTMDLVKSWEDLPGWNEECFNKEPKTCCRKIASATLEPYDTHSKPQQPKQ